MSYHVCKIYLNTQLSAILSQLNSDDALIIINYKIRINSKKAKETKGEWFDKQVDKAKTAIDLYYAQEYIVVDIINEVEINLKHERYILQQHQKIRELIKQILIHVKYLLETMFCIETVDLRKKITIVKMRSKLMQRVQKREIEKENVSKESTISN
ncbi:hypothetical protein Glove_34g78 [Diversispora epigaea]|uniref:Uncharacterized protein n=1 Tax=Diversispora epigaea TaxID=1348612 RepID=A0A397JQK4_9GLOM|nr:hypothetical protein Glove_34g78 [Diversispora epigaea]